MKLAFAVAAIGIATIPHSAFAGVDALEARVNTEDADRFVAIYEAAGGAPTNLLWLEGRAVSFSKSISYWPFLLIIKTCAGISEEDDEGETWEKLEGKVTSLFPGHVAEILPYLASLLALEVRSELSERVKYLDGEAMARQIFRATRRFFKRLSFRHPLLLVFEDLQWADQSSIDLLEHLFPLVREVPLMICCVSRLHHHSPGTHLLETSTREYTERFSEIAVVPLSSVDSAILLSNIAMA